MSSARFSVPHRVGDVLTAAVPALAERMLAERIRRAGRQPSAPSWPGAPGPASLERGTLEVMADNSPWLQELSMRSAEVLEALRAAIRPDRHLAALQPRRARAGPRAPGPAPRRPARRRCGSTPTSWPVEGAAAPVRDEALASTVRPHHGQGPDSPAGGGGQLDSGT